MLQSLYNAIYQTTPIHAAQFLTNHHPRRASSRRLQWSVRRKVLASVVTASTQRLVERGEKEAASKSFNFDDSFDSSEQRRFESPKVDVKEIEELPEQWRRSKLAWLCKELPAHRSGTFVRLLNAQRKWIRQDDCTYVAVHFMRIRENEAAYRVYKWMMEQHWAQFDFSLATRLADYMGKERKHTKCREIFDDIVNQGLIPSESTFHILIVAYLSSSSSSCLDEACSIYNQMIHLGGYKPLLSLHNALFRALLSKPGGSCKHHLQQAEFIFNNLMMNGLKIHSDIYGGLIWLHSYQDVIDKERISSLREEMKSMGVKESMEVLVSVIRACSKDGDVVEAERTWKSILWLNNKPPTQAFLYLMEVYSKAGKVMRSLEVFRDMQARGLSTVVSCCKIIEILCKARETDHAESLMAEFINSGMKPSIRSSIDLMNMYFDLNQHDKVETTFFLCLENTSSPNHTLYSIYLDSLVAENNLAKAEEVFNLMHSDETVGIDSNSCNTLLKGYLASEKHHLKSEKIYELMCQKKYNVEPSLKEKLEHIQSLRRQQIEKLQSLKLSQEQREILTGFLLGSLRVRPEGKKSSKVHFVFRDDCNVHSSLKRHIYNQFHEWLSFKPNDNDIPCDFSTISHPYFKFYSDQFYPQDHQPTIPKLIHRWLTPRVLAYWYMYSGYRTSSGDILLKLRFGEEDVARIARALKAKSLNCRVKRKGKAYWMGFLGGDAAAFWRTIEPFVVADLRESLQAGIESSDKALEEKNDRFGNDFDTDENISGNEDDDIQRGNAHVPLSSHENMLLN